MPKILFAAAVALPLAACATTSTSHLTAEQMAACQKMQAEMGTAQQHDHAEAKGQGTSAMNMNHERCRQMMDKS
jgi:hypothetical protein